MRARRVPGLEACAQLIVQLGECVRAGAERLVFDHTQT
jgi:hypothetical protein